MGVGVGKGDEDVPFTPPQPIVKARNRVLNKNKNARLKYLHLSNVFESGQLSLVGFIIHGFLTNNLGTA
jgi:hypothetical protein